MRTNLPHPSHSTSRLTEAGRVDGPTGGGPPHRPPPADLTGCSKNRRSHGLLNLRPPGESDSGDSSDSVSDSDDSTSVSDSDDSTSVSDFDDSTSVSDSDDIALADS